MPNKRPLDQMLHKQFFHPPFNSTFVDNESKECAQVVHDLVFQKYGIQRKLYRSKRLKVLREIFYPDLTNGSYPRTNSVIDFQDMMRINKDHHSSMKESTKHQLNRSKTFCVGEKRNKFLDVQRDKEGHNLNDPEEFLQRELNETQSVGSQDISDLLTDPSTNFSNTKSPSRSVNDDNNNTIIEECNEINDLQSCIEAQEMAIQEFQKVLTFGRRKRGFAGSIPHIQAEKGTLIANLRKQVLTDGLHNEFQCPPTMGNSLKGRITIKNIKCDTNIIIGDNHGIPPCYYLCILQHETTVLSTDILAPDMHGIVDFPSNFTIENVTNTFTMKLLLFKLQLKPSSENISWRVSLTKRHFELPKLDLIGSREISIANIRTTSFPFENEILYANFTPCISGPIRKAGYLTIQKIVRKTKQDTKLVSHKRWCVLEGTDLKAYRSCQDVDHSAPLEVISLVYCKSCRPYYFSPTTLRLNFVHTHFGRTLYLPFSDKNSFREWFNIINQAIVAAESFGL